MTEATKRPWYAYGIHVQSAVIEVHELNEGYSSVCTTEGDTPEEAVANADLIVKAVNNHDALVAALEDAVTWLHLASQNHGTSPLITKQHQVEAAKIEAALEAAK
jgi:hypothetical protein